jgi:hypothetical protein
VSPRHRRRGPLFGSLGTLRPSRPGRRFGVVVTLVLLVVALVLVDNHVGVESAPVAQPRGTAVRSQAISSAWYCAMVPSLRANPAAGQVIVSNPNDTAITGTVSLYPARMFPPPVATPPPATTTTTASVTSSTSTPPVTTTTTVPVATPVEVPITVPARSRTALRPGDIVDASFASVLVWLDGGGALVDHQLYGSLAPCVTDASKEWHIVSANSEGNSSALIALMNPFDDDAIADVNLATDQGAVQPPALQGTVVPAHSALVVNLADHVKRRVWIAGTVEVRRGRLAVDQAQLGLIDGAAGQSFTPAASTTSTSWHIADGAVSATNTDHLNIYNPSGAEAIATVRVVLEQGEQPAPFQLRVPARGRIALALEQQSRIPKDVRYSIEVVADRPVVAGRSVTASGGPLAGGVIQTGVPLQARGWGVGAGTVADPGDEWIYVANQQSVAVDVRVRLIGDGKEESSLPAVHLEAGQRWSIHVDQVAGVDRAAFIDASAPVVVGRAQYDLASKTFSWSNGVPFTG